jgi:hypothetical protein
MNSSASERCVSVVVVRGGTSARVSLSAPLDVLAIAVIATVVGLAAAAFRGDGSAFNSFLFLNLGFGHNGAALIERAAVSIVLVASVAGMIGRRWWLWVPAAIHILTEAALRLEVQGEAYSDWVFMTHAARYVAPLALMMLLLGAASEEAGRWWTMAGRWALRLALAAVFASHGVEALRANPAFIDLIISTAANVIDTRVTESTARTLLEIVGVIDLVAAGAMLLRLNPVLLGWAAFWAGITAFSRLTANGWGAYPDVLIRASYYLGPVVLWLLMKKQVTRATTQLRPILDRVIPTSRKFWISR